MARFNKIYLGPVSEAKPQVLELPAADADLSPGNLLVIASGKFDNAAATTVGKVWIAQDNYLAMKGVDDDYAADDVVIGMELLPEQIYAGRIANGVNITAIGTPLTPAAGGLLAIASTSDKVIGYSTEAYNNNSGSEQLISFRPSQGYLTAAA
ncbi:hypothetical protein KUV46_15730 [Thalassovita mediterranea]|nr:hypothetical protein KUV46_15730 [Thalassovita mediterranea]